MCRILPFPCALATMSYVFTVCLQKCGVKGGNGLLRNGKCFCLTSTSGRAWGVEKGKEALRVTVAYTRVIITVGRETYWRYKQTGPGFSEGMGMNKKEKSRKTSRFSKSVGSMTEAYSAEAQRGSYQLYCSPLLTQPRQRRALYFAMYMWKQYFSIFQI